MYRSCIALVDATRARLFTYDRSAEGNETREALVEHTDLINPARHQPASELFSDTRPGRNRTGNLSYAFDDHRDHHVAQLDAEFARTAMAAFRELVDEYAPQRATVCAAPRMLGNLRAAAPGLLPDGLPVDELPRDLVKLQPQELRDQLTKHGVLPARPSREAR